MLEQASNIATILELAIAIIALLGGIGGIVAYKGYRKFRKAKDVRLYQNISRPFAVVSTEQQSMTNEVDLLERADFFKPEHFGIGGRSLQLLGDIKPRLLVIGYSPNSTTYKAALDYARTHTLPVVVFARQHRMTPNELADLKAYNFSSLCETELRLISDVFSVMSTFPEDK